LDQDLRESAMNLTDARYSGFALVREMLETPGIVGRFDFGQSAQVAQAVKQSGKLFLTGEGSSRIFPAKNLMYDRMRIGAPVDVFTDGARQAHEYRLGDFLVFGASNSGKTKEVISLFTQLASQGHALRFGLTAHRGTPLEALCNRCFTLGCGKEDAVAATKSVVEQAVFYRSLLAHFEAGQSPLVSSQRQAAEAAQAVLEAQLDPELVRRIAAAPTVYFAGRNNGVAEELALKTNEITHKKSDYLEGTYAVHGIEEVMRGDEVVIVVDPFPEEMQKFQEVLVDGVGLEVIAVASRATIFPTIRIPEVEGYETVLQLLAGWNILVSVGVALGINLDKAERARKIGNEAVAAP
jgi:glucosamine--fructose-6-phosphate aminotransferase (isomerizing)